MSKQTAVDFLKEKLTYIFINDDGFHRLFEQAKVMEREQIIDAWISTDNELQRLAAEQYYNETYKGGEQ